MGHLSVYVWKATMGTAKFVSVSWDVQDLLSHLSIHKKGLLSAKLEEERPT